MASFYDYTHATGSNVDVSARVRAYRTELRSNAEEGSVAISTVIIDDPEGGLDIKGLRPFTWSETAESSNSLIIYKGYTADRGISRGPFRNGVGRIWTVNVTDQNAIINRRIMRGADANRPAETDVARVQWLMTTGEFGNVVADSTYISTAAPVAMDAVDYRNQRCQDILDDCAQQSGKNFFIILNELSSPPPYALFYDFAGSTAYASTIRLTNVLADVDNPVTNSSTTFAVIDERTKLKRDPSRVYAGVVLPFDGGEVFQYDPAIATEFHPRDTMAPSVNVKTTAKATARALRYLADNATEDDVIEFAFLVPLAKVNRLKEGMTFQIKLSHVPGYTDWTWMRVLNRTVIATSEEYYTVAGEATPAAASTPAVLSCANQVPPASWDSGSFGNPGDHTPPPLTVTPSVGDTAAKVIVAGMMSQNGAGAFGYSTVLGGYTQMGVYTEGGAVPGGVITMVGAAYKAVPALGAGGNLTMSWSANAGTEVWRSLAIALSTSATSPVQTKEQCTSGHIITLTSTPTVGNILVLVRFVETSPFAQVPAGFTQIVSGNVVSSSPGVLTADICVRCVQAGDSATVTTFDTGFTHWQFLSEWALT